MALEADDEILQDFLVEAGEILELLGEQLVELEQIPQDAELLNAVFRGFHTVKGGAGFLALTNMVAVCHRAEDVFNVLRQGERQLDPELMDHFLQVLDILNEQFDQIRSAQEPSPASPQLLTYLESKAVPATEDTHVAASPVQEVAPVDSGASASTGEQAAGDAAAAEGDITDDEFESLLDSIAVAKAAQSAATDGNASVEAAPAAAPGGEISDEEFERLLDDLHGKGKHGGVPEEGGTAPGIEAGNHQAAANTGAVSSAAADEVISEEDFDKLLDQLHGKGKAPGVADAGEQTTQAAPPSPTPAEKKPVPATKPAPTASQAAPAASVSETAAAPIRQPSKPVAEATVRVDTKRLDDIMNMVGELVLVRNRLDTLGASLGNEEVSKAVDNLDIVTSDLQAAVMKTRMQPIKKVFGRFPRVVRDLARSLQKEVELELVGEETDLDKNLVEALADPLVHLVRNSVDHGIEMPDVRASAGKPRVGKVTLAAAQAGDHILLTITDDGAGMDPGKLRRIAVDKGVMDEESAARLSDSECYNLIFAPGFSTKTEISDVSGRGVGMDVVKTRITQLNGTIHIESEKGQGSRISIQLPLTLAILPTLMVKVGDRNYALPLSSVNEIFHKDDAKTNTVDGQLVVMLRNKALPLFYLHEWLSHDVCAEHAESEQVVIAQSGNQRVGFVVSQVVGQEEVVIKPLGALLHGLPGFAGATITGDGRIALILDVPSLMKTYGHR